MTEDFVTNNPELDALFERFREAPNSHVFAPLADACRKAGMIEEAIDIVERGVNNSPDYASGHVVRGKCYYDHDNAAEAESSFTRVLELDPNNLVALKYLGMILAERGDLAGARERFKHILALDPEDKEIKFKMEDLGATPPAPDPVPGDAPGATDARDNVEPMELRDVPDETFEGAPISLGDDDGSTTDELATMTLADIYAAQGYHDKALRIYRDVLNRQPDNDDVRRKIEMLSERKAPAQPDPEAAPVEVPDVGVDGEAAFEEVTDSTGKPVRTPVEDAAPVPSVEAKEKAPSRTDTARAPVEGKDYDQFKRWLKNLSD